MKKTLLSVIFVFIFTATATFGQSSLESAYNKFEDFTNVIGKKASLVKDVTEVSFTPIAAYKGQAPKDFGSIEFYLNFSHIWVSNQISEQRLKFDGSTLILLIDDKERISGKMKFSHVTPKATYSEGVPYYITSHYNFLLKVNFEQLKRLSEAKTVEVRWNGQPKDYAFNPAAIASAKEMVDYFEKLKSSSPK